ncbi:MAG: DnaA/Hda family protein, partial [Proteobacteria bacterium]|nr:DnaA/Hda family protein [Pseudomonadota bacterium]
LISALLQLTKSREINAICLNADSVSQAGLLNLLSGYEVLVLEDIHSLASNEQLELNLFNVFNYSVQNKKKLIVSSRFSAKSDKWNLPDLKSRLNSGQTFHLKPLKGDKAFGLIFELMSKQGMVLDMNAKKYISIHYPSDFPSLFKMMGILNKSSLAEKKKVTIALLKETLSCAG